MNKDKIKSALIWSTTAIIYLVIALPSVYYGFVYQAYLWKFVHDLNWSWFFSLLLIFVISLISAGILCLLVLLVFYLQKKTKERLNNLFESGPLVLFYIIFFYLLPLVLFYLIFFSN